MTALHTSAAGCVVVLRGLNPAHSAMTGVQASMPPDSGGHERLPPDLRLEFQISDIGQKVEIPDLTEIMYHDITQKVDEKDVIGLQVVPQRWPRKVQILCAHQAAMDCLMIRGLDVYGRHIDLNVPGQGMTKIHIQDAPLGIPNDVLKDWVAQFGTVTEFRNEHVTVRRRRTSWRTGTRVAYVKMLKQPVPPSAKIQYKGEDIVFSAWHYGQSHIKCRFCHDIVPKGHTCDKGPSRRCYNCGSDSHIKMKCTQGKACFKCGSTSHIARDCVGVLQIESTIEFPLLPPRPSAGGQNRTQAANSEGVLSTPDLQQANEPISTSTDEAEISATDDETTDETNDMDAEDDDVASVHEEVADVQNDSAEDSVVIDTEMENLHDHQLDVLLIGGSNCRDMNMEGDDQLKLNTSLLIQGGLPIEEMAEKIEELNAETKLNIAAIVVNVGACDFPVKEDRDVKRHYMNYVEGINTIRNDCPKAHIIMSSILPRAGKNKERANSEINLFNKMVQDLAEEEGNLHFCSNSMYFEQEEGVIGSLYKDADTFGIHVNTEGKERLIASITAVIKEVYFKEKYLEASASPIA